MTQDKTTPPGAPPTAGANRQPPADPLAGALNPLTTYGEGSDRGALTPLDEAVRAAGGDPGKERDLEKRLLGLLESGISPLAKEYLCGKLALIGASASVPALARLLADTPLSYAARSALEAIATPRAVRALRGSLGQLAGEPKAGVIRSLGVLRDARSVSALSRLLDDPNPEIAASAIAALGHIASPAAAEGLRSALPKAGESLRPTLFDAGLNCAERLQAGGRATPAGALLQAMAAASPPAHVRRAIEGWRARP